MINNFANLYDTLPQFGLGFGLFMMVMMLFFLLIIASVVLKGYAMWIAARRDDKGWFVILLVFNTFGILELIYLYFIADIWNKNNKAKIEEKPVASENKPNEPV